MFFINLPVHCQIYISFPKVHCAVLTDTIFFAFKSSHLFAAFKLRFVINKTAILKKKLLKNFLSVFHLAKLSFQVCLHLKLVMF